MTSNNRILFALVLVFACPFAQPQTPPPAKPSPTGQHQTSGTGVNTKKQAGSRGDRIVVVSLTANGKKLPGAAIAFQPQKGQSLQCVTDDAGECRPHLDTGKYTVSVTQGRNKMIKTVLIVTEDTTAVPLALDSH